MQAAGVVEANGKDKSAVAAYMKGSLWRVLKRLELGGDEHAPRATLGTHRGGRDANLRVSLDATKAARHVPPMLCDRAECEFRIAIGAAT